MAARQTLQSRASTTVRRQKNTFVTIWCKTWFSPIRRFTFYDLLLLIYEHYTVRKRVSFTFLKVQIEQTSIMLEYDRWIYQHTNCECLHDSLVFYLSRTHWGDFWHFEPELTICLKLSCLDWICLSMCLSVAFASFLLCFSSNSRGPVQRLLERLFRKQWAVSTTLHFFFWDCS